jgi:hypothetical protein
MADGMGSQAAHNNQNLAIRIQLLAHQEGVENQIDDSQTVRAADLQVCLPGRIGSLEMPGEEGH